MHVRPALVVFLVIAGVLGVAWVVVVLRDTQRSARATLAVAEEVRDVIAVEPVAAPVAPTIYRAEYVDLERVNRICITSSKPGETLAQLLERHVAELAAFELLFPRK